jgi:HK97 family phage major capsid protein
MTTTAQPETAASWEEYLQGLDTPEAFTKAMNDSGDTGFKARSAAYFKTAVEQKTKESQDIAAQVQEFTQAALVDLFRQNGAGKQGAALAAARLNQQLHTGANQGLKGLRSALAYNPEAPAAKLDGQFSNFGEFIQTIWHHRVSGKHRIAGAKAADLDAKFAVVNEYSIKVPDSGGFLVPEEYRPQLLMLGLEESIVLPRATVVPMNSQTLILPTVDATSNVSSVFGGVVVYRTEEGEEFVESQAKFGRVKLDVTKQTALAYLTNELIRESAPAVSSILGQMIPQAMAYQADLDFLSGSGAGEPLGALATGNPALLAVSGESGQTADTIVWQNVLRAYARQLPQSIGRTVWIASPDTFVELATMALEVGTGGSAVWITDGTGSPVLTLLGRPVIMSEKTPGVLGDKGDLSLVDFTYYLIGVRDNLMVDTSDHVKFTSDQTTIRAIARNDGRPWLNSAITPHNGGPTLSPFVTLAAR